MGIRRLTFTLLLLTSAGPEAAWAQSEPGIPGQATAPVSVAGNDSAPTPRAAFQTFRSAARAERWTDAAALLSLDDTTRARGPELAERLNAVIESLYQLDPEMISAEPAGRLDDGLPEDVEEIAEVERGDGEEPIRLVRLGGERPTWVFTSSTVAHVDDWYQGLRSRRLREWIANAGLAALLREGPLNIFYWQWLAFPVVALLAWAVGRGIQALATPLAGMLTRRSTSVWDDRIVESLEAPFVLAVSAMVFAAGMLYTDLNREAYRIVTTLVRPTLTFAAFWAIWRLSAVLLAWSLNRSWALNSPSARNFLTIGTNISKGLIVGLGVVAMLAAVGFPVGTVLAGLGIGGLAVAFGAQKTVENLFGSLALAVDQPIRVGDFVRVQDFTGTVEDIGIRSTRVRTLDRTVVSIPNGRLADERLESYALRDRMRLATVIGLTYGTTRQQVETVLRDVDQLLRSHPNIWPEGITVKLQALGQNGLEIEVSAWFQAPTWDVFTEIRQQILLAIMEVIERAGTSLAYPTRTVHLIPHGHQQRSAVDGRDNEPREPVP